MRFLYALVIVVAASFATGCDKDSASSNSAGEEGSAVAKGPAGQAKLSKAYWGTYKGDKRHQVVVMPTGIKSSGIICSRTVSFDSVTCTDDGCDWVAKGGEAKGNLSFMDDKSLMISSSGLGAGCYDEGLSGQFTKLDAAAASADKPSEGPGKRSDKAPAEVAKKRPALPSSSGFSVGETVEAKWSGTWYDAKIMKQRPGQYYITYPGYSSSWDQWVGADKLRKKGGSKAAAAVAAPSGDGFSVGSRVSCNWKSGGIYYKGKITRKSGSSIHVSYDDGDQEDTVTSKCRLLGGGSAGASAGMVNARVTVKVDDKKPNGKAWDAFGGKPDISLCVSGGGSTQCYPDGGSVLEIMEPQCRDTFRCTFSGVKVPKGSFTLTVVDVDFAANDRVGSASCKKGGSCSGGSASISVR